MRYIILILLNLPIILLACLNLLTKYKTNKITKRHLARRVTLWAVILIVIVGSFPVYNILSGNSPLESSNLSFFDIVQTTCIVALIYIVSNMGQKLESVDKRLRDLHQEMSIKLSNNK